MDFNDFLILSPTLRICWQMWSLSFFHLRPALLHTRLAARVVSLNHGSILGLGHRTLRGATVSRLPAQVERKDEVRMRRDLLLHCAGFFMNEKSSGNKQEIVCGLNL